MPNGPRKLEALNVEARLSITHAALPPRCMEQCGEEYLHTEEESMNEVHDSVTNLSTQPAPGTYHQFDPHGLRPEVVPANTGSRHASKVQGFSTALFKHIPSLVLKELCNRLAVQRP